MLDVPLGVDADTATLAWLVSVLEHARARDQSKLVDYLEAVADDLVFEVEFAARRGGYVRQRRYSPTVPIDVPLISIQHSKQR
jgi:hypothetical protein